MSRIDEIRERLTPEQWLQGLRAARKSWDDQLIQLMVDRDVVDSATEFDKATKAAVLANMDTQILELDARVTEIDERIEGAAKGASGLPRAARRRLQKSVSKNSNKEEAPIDA